MLTNLHPLWHSRCLTRVFPSCTFKELRNLSQTSWSSPRILNQCELRTFGSYFLRPSVVYFSCQLRPSEDVIKIGKVILSLETVKEQLELFERIKNSADIVNRVTMLHCIAKITGRDGNQRRVLKQENGKSRQVLNSAYLALLTSIAKDIAKCKPRDLANVMWALGKLGEKEHKLVNVCERAILSRDITAFDNVHISQIVSGCINLDLTASEIPFMFQESIRNGQLKISNFNDHLLSVMSKLFAKTNGYAVELLDISSKEILSRDVSFMGSYSDFAFSEWPFAKNELKPDTLFDRVEEKNLRRGTANLGRHQFARGGEKKLFDIIDNELALRGLQGFDNSKLLQIVWSFATRDVTNAKVFDLVKDEVLKRDVGRFRVHELVLLLYSFVSARRQDNKLVEEIESELLSRDVEQFDNGNLCQVAWSLGRARKSDSKMFDLIEESVLQRGLHQFSKSETFLLLRGYTEAKRGSKQLYEGLQVSFLTSRFPCFAAADIFDLAWCFSEAEVNTGPLINTGPLFDTLERDILTKGKYFFTEKQLIWLEKSFQKVGKGTNKLFEL